MHYAPVQKVPAGSKRNYISGFEGSQAVPACPSGIGNAY
jgi:hypothetical protein